MLSVGLIRKGAIQSTGSQIHLLVWADCDKRPSRPQNPFPFLEHGHQFMPLHVLAEVTGIYCPNGLITQEGQISGVPLEELLVALQRRAVAHWHVHGEGLWMDGGSTESDVQYRPLCEKRFD